MTNKLNKNVMGNQKYACEIIAWPKTMDNLTPTIRMRIQFPFEKLTDEFINTEM